MNKFMKFVKRQIREPSTWRGLVMVATALGASISPDVATAIDRLIVGLTTAGILGVASPDKTKKVKEMEEDIMAEKVIEHPYVQEKIADIVDRRTK